MYTLVTDQSLKDSVLESCGLLVYGIGQMPIYINPPSEGKVAQYQDRNYLIFKNQLGVILVVDIPQGIYDPIKAQEAYTSGAGIGDYLTGFGQGVKQSLDNLTSGSKTVLYILIAALIIYAIAVWKKS